MKNSGSDSWRRKGLGSFGGCWMKGQDGLVLCQRWRWFQVRKIPLKQGKNRYEQGAVDEVFSVFLATGSQNWADSLWGSSSEGRTWDWEVPEEQLVLEAAWVNSLLHHSLVASKGVPASQDGLNAPFYWHTCLILNSQDICLFILIVPDNNSKPLEGKIVFRNAVSHFICLMI